MPLAQQRWRHDAFTHEQTAHQGHMLRAFYGPPALRARGRHRGKARGEAARGVVVVRLLEVVEGVVPELLDHEVALRLDEPRQLRRLLRRVELVDDLLELGQDGGARRGLELLGLLAALLLLVLLGLLLGGLLLGQLLGGDVVDVASVLALVAAQQLEGVGVEGGHGQHCPALSQGSAVLRCGQGGGSE